jgi:hypothetical protein
VPADDVQQVDADHLQCCCQELCDARLMNGGTGLGRWSGREYCAGHVRACMHTRAVLHVAAGTLLDADASWMCSGPTSVQAECYVVACVMGGCLLVERCRHGCCVLSQGDAQLLHLAC